MQSTRTRSHFPHPQVDIDSTVCQAYGDTKQGAAYGYTRVLGYYPVITTLADGGDVSYFSRAFVPRQETRLRF